MVQKKFLGFFLVFFSALLLLLQTGNAPLPSLITWPFLLFSICILLIFVGFLKSNAQLVLVAGIAASISIYIWGVQNVNNWPSHWSILIIFFGLTVFLQYLLNRHNLTIVIAIILLLSGICAYPGIREYESLAPIASTLNTYWPVFILGLGLYLLFRK